MRGVRRSFVAEGLNLERYLRCLSARGVRITGVIRRSARQMELTAFEDHMPEILHLAEEGGWRVAIGSRMGIGRAGDFFRNRWILTISMLSALLLPVVLAQFMWDVQVVNAGAYAAEMRIALRELGVMPPMLRSQVDIGTIRSELEQRYPRVAWIECGWRGTTLEVRLVEGVLPEGTSVGSTGDVVASRDGVVRQIVTRAGTPVVAVGDLVRKGQVLIRGEERTADGAVRAVQAEGSVYARVWVQAVVRTPLQEVRTEYTGRTEEVFTVEAPWFPLWRIPESWFEAEDVAVSVMPLGGFFLPLTLRRETRMEAEFTQISRDLQAAREEGADAALRKLTEIAGGKESLVDNWVNWSIIEDEILLSAATGEMLVDIAQQERDSGMAATE